MVRVRHKVHWNRRFPVTIVKWVLTTRGREFTTITLFGRREPWGSVTILLGDPMNAKAISTGGARSPQRNPFDALDRFETGHGSALLYRIRRLEALGLTQVDRLPYSIRILLESVLRNCDGTVVQEQDVRAVAAWSGKAPAEREIPFHPTRVVLQDFTGVPAVVDLAAMRSAMKRLGGDPKQINPLIPVDLVIDHSVQVDRFGSADALQQNVDLEFQRNRERYEFLRWGQKAFANFRAVPPNMGIVHQVNLEFLAKGTFLRGEGESRVAVPDTLVGTDSHTTMINGLGVVGWGVGGIEAEAVMLGQPLYLLLPEVVGFELCGSLPAGATATDLVLTVTQILRRAGVVGKFVEFFGGGIRKMPVADRATIANMAPEYGATMGYFPVDDESLNYMRRTGRTDEEVRLVEWYFKELGAFRSEQAAVPEFSSTLRLDLETVEPSLAGPKRPQDRVPLGSVKSNFEKSLRAPVADRGFALTEEDLRRTATVANGQPTKIGHGAVVIAAITSCTNTSNPSVMIAAGLLARNAARRGLRVPHYVKTSLAPGSRVVTEYLNKSGLSADLDALGFYTVGYGCTTCIGNSGPLPDSVSRAVVENKLIASAVLSGNRNFEGRVNPLVQANYLASPPLVVAFAIAGRTDVDLTRDPLGMDPSGQPVYLRDIWPTREEIENVLTSCLDPHMFASQYGRAFDANEQWNRIQVAAGELYTWDEASTYIQEPPFLQDISLQPAPLPAIRSARTLCLLGDSVTTDHISPAGNISKSSPAGEYLMQLGVAPADFNSYGARRGNDRVMVRGTFANIRIRNQMAPGTEGGVTLHQPSRQLMSIYEASRRYQQEKVPLLVMAGTEYGSGSSRDWAAKGTLLLGVRAVLAVSYERIHRSNLVGMGVLPLEFRSGSTWQSLGITGSETFDVEPSGSWSPRGTARISARREDGSTFQFDALVRIDSSVELEYYHHGGILPMVLRKMMA